MSEAVLQCVLGGRVGPGCTQVDHCRVNVFTSLCPEEGIRNFSSDFETRSNWERGAAVFWGISRPFLCLLEGQRQILESHSL